MIKNYQYTILIVVLLNLSLVVSYGQVVSFDSLELADFKKFDSGYSSSTETLISKITPSETYDSWILKYKHAHFDEETLLKRGKWRRYRRKLDSVSSNSGFFVACMPSLCYYYIVGIISNESHLIDNVAEFKRFIGNIDNLAELELIVRLNGYRIDRDTLLLGSYFETDQGYYLYMTKYQPSPEKFWSVRAHISKTGHFDIIDERLFKETGRRLMY